MLPKLVEMAQTMIWRRVIKVGGRQADECCMDPYDVLSGFARPKVLILLPFRSSAYLWVNSLLDLVGDCAVALQL